MERALPGEYSAMIFRHLDTAKPHDWLRLVALAKSAELVRGYGHIKEANVAKLPRRNARGCKPRSGSRWRWRLNSSLLGREYFQGRG